MGLDKPKTGLGPPVCDSTHPLTGDVLPGTTRDLTFIRGSMESLGTEAYGHREVRKGHEWRPEGQVSRVRKSYVLRRNLEQLGNTGRKGWVKRVSAAEGSGCRRLGGVGWPGGAWGTRADKTEVSQFSPLSSRHTGTHTCRVHLLFCYLLSFLSLRTNCALGECEHPRPGSPRAASVNDVLF